MLSVIFVIAILVIAGILIRKRLSTRLAAIEQDPKWFSAGLAAIEQDSLRRRERIVTSESSLEFAMLDGKSKDELVAIADALGAQTHAQSSKADIIRLILATTNVSGLVGSADSTPKPATSPVAAPSAKPSARKPTAGAPPRVTEIMVDAEENTHEKIISITRGLPKGYVCQVSERLARNYGFGPQLLWHFWVEDAVGGNGARSFQQALKRGLAQSGVEVLLNTAIAKRVTQPVPVLEMVRSSGGNHEVIVQTPLVVDHLPRGNMLRVQGYAHAKDLITRNGQVIVILEDSDTRIPLPASVASPPRH